MIEVFMYVLAGLVILSIWSSLSNYVSDSEEMTLLDGILGLADMVLMIALLFTPAWPFGILMMTTTGGSIYSKKHFEQNVSNNIAFSFNTINLFAKAYLIVDISNLHIFFNNW